MSEPAPAIDPLIQVEDLHTYYGKSHILHGVSLEEGPGGIYDLCEQLAGDDVASQLARAHAIPTVRVSQHLDEPRVHEHIKRMVAARARNRT